MTARLFVLAAPTMVALMLVGSPSRAFAATPELAFSPTNATVALGGNTNVEITVAGVDAELGLGGYDIALSFDPAVAQLTSLVDAGLVTQGQNIVICNPASIDNTAGTATASCGTLPIFGFPGVAVATPVPLMHAVFSAQAPGNATLSLAGSVLEDPVGGSLTVTFVAGSITVPGATSATPTPAPDASVPSASATPAPAVAASATPGAATEARANSSPVMLPGSQATGNGAASVKGNRSTTGTVGLPSSGVGPEPLSASRDIRRSLILLFAASGVLFAGMFGIVRKRRS